MRVWVLTFVLVCAQYEGCDCNGARSKRLVHGHTGRCPFFASIQSYFRNSNSSDYKVLRCGGTLLTESAILTAAHCVFDVTTNSYAESLEVAINSYNTDIMRPRRFTIIAIDYDVNEAFQRTVGIVDDFAIVYLPRALRICEDEPSFTVTPIWLDENRVPFAQRNDLTSWKCSIFGFGVTEKGSLSKVMKMGVIENLSLKLVDGRWTLTSHHSKFFAGKPCQGDSGGPVVCIRGNEIRQIGIISEIEGKVKSESVGDFSLSLARMCGRSKVLYITDIDRNIPKIVAMLEKRGMLLKLYGGQEKCYANGLRVSGF